MTVGEGPNVDCLENKEFIHHDAWVQHLRQFSCGNDLQVDIIFLLSNEQDKWTSLVCNYLPLCWTQLQEQATISRLGKTGLEGELRFFGGVGFFLVWPPGPTPMNPSHAHPGMTWDHCFIGLPSDCVANSVVGKNGVLVLVLSWLIMLIKSVQYRCFIQVCIFTHF